MFGTCLVNGHTKYMKELKELRERLGWSQEEMGHALGYAGRKAVSNIERGREEMGGSARRQFELLLIYEHLAGRLWDASRADKIKPILEDDDE